MPRSRCNRWELREQAAAAGGELKHLLGNHELMNLQGRSTTSTVSRVPETTEASSPSMESAAARVSGPQRSAPAACTLQCQWGVRGSRAQVADVLTAELRKT